MRILYFSRDYTPHDHRFLAAIQAAGHETYYLRLEAGMQVKERRQLPSGVKKIAWRGGNAPLRWKDWPGLMWDLQRVLGEVKPDLVHAGPIQKNAFPVALLGYQPLLSMSWGSDILRGAKKGIGRRIARYTLHRSRLFLCDSQAVAAEAQELGMPSEKMRIFPWGVDIDHFHPGLGGALRAKLGWEQNFVILSARSWEPIYGLDVLIEGFISAARKEDSLRMLILGGGSLEPFILDRIEGAQLHEKVHFAGQVGYADLPSYYGASDLYLSASHSDGSSISLLEAMACGLPVLVSDIPGNCEWVEKGENGWTFPDGSSQALAAAILQAVSLSESLPSWGARARSIAEERAEWEQNARILMESYQLALAMGD